MKKIVCIILCVTMSLIAGCGKGKKGDFSAVPETGVAWNTPSSELEKAHGTKCVDIKEGSDDNKVYYFDYNLQGTDGEFRYVYDKNDEKIVSALYFVRMDSEQDRFNSLFESVIKKYTDELGEPNYTFENEVAKSIGWTDKEKNVPLIIMGVNMPLLNNTVNTMSVVWYNPEGYSEETATQGQ